MLHFFVSGFFDVSSFNDSRDMEGVPNSTNRSRDPFTTPFDLILHLFVSATRGLYACQSFYIHAFLRYEKGPKISKVGHVTLS